MRLISKAELARLKGVLPSAVTHACKGDLGAAVVGDRIDVDHQAAVAYLADTAESRMLPSGKRQAPKGAGRKKLTSTRADTVPQTTTQEAPRLDDYGFSPEIEDLTAKQISERYGTSRAYVDWLDAYQKQQRGRELWLKNEALEGSLISRELVQHHVFGAIDSSHKRLLTDAAKTMAARLYALCRAGTSLEEAEREAREIISKQLKPVKVTAKRILGDGGS